MVILSIETRRQSLLEAKDLCNSSATPNYVYILANDPKILYIGVTNNREKQIRGLLRVKESCADCVEESCLA
jgi:hypothetical protein